MLHWLQSSIAFDEMAAARFRFPHTDRATTVPSAGGMNNPVKSTHGTLGAEFVKLRCGKSPRIFSACSGYFLKSFIHLMRTAVKTP